MKEPGGSNYFELAKEFGYTFREMSEMTSLQITYLLTGINEERKRKKKEAERTRGKGKSRRR